MPRPVRRATNLWRSNLFKMISCGLRPKSLKSNQLLCLRLRVEAEQLRHSCNYDRFATFFVLREKKKILSPTDWQLKIKWNCRLKIQNRFRHSKVIVENMKFSSFKVGKWKKKFELNFQSIKYFDAENFF